MLLQKRGVDVQVNKAVTGLEAGGDMPAIIAGGKKHSFDKVLFTMDCPTILAIASPGGTQPYWDALQRVKYLGVCCVTLVLDRKLSPYYVINLLDKSLPFTGIIEATNVVDPSRVAGRHLVYLPKYAPADDPIWSLPDDEVIDVFVKGLKKVFPGLRDPDILHRMVSREKYVQPLQELGALDRLPGHATPLRGVYAANSSMLTNTTLNNNAAISLAKRAAGEITTA